MRRVFKMQHLQARLLSAGISMTGIYRVAVRGKERTAGVSGSTSLRQRTYYSLPSQSIQDT